MSISSSTVAKGNNSRKTKAQLIEELGRLQRRVDELEHVADECTRVKGLLSERTAQLNSILEHAPLMISLKDAEGRYVLMNRQLLTSYGLADEEVEGGLPHDLFSTEFADLLVAHDRAVLEAGQVVEREIVDDRTDGVRTYLAVKFPILGASGEVTGVGGIGTDITERKRAEEKLRATERRYRELFEFAPISLWEEDWSGAKKLIDGLRAQGVHDLHRYFTEHPEFVRQFHAEIRYVDVNVVTLEMYGARDKRELIEEMHVRNPEPPREYALDRYVALAQGQPKVTGEHTSRRIDGTDIDVRVTVSIPQAYQTDWSRVLVAVEDISERKVAQNALAEKTALLDAFINNAPINMGVKDTQGRYVFVNPNWASSFGFSKEDVPGKTAFDIFPKDAADEYRAQDLEVFKTRANSTIEITVRHSDGTDHFYLAKKFPILDGAGEAFALGWMDIDITDRKRAEEALRQANDSLERRVDERTAELQEVNEQLRKEIVERNKAQQALAEQSALLDGLITNSPMPITVKRTDGSYLLVNRAGEEAYGSPKEEILGKTNHELFPKKIADGYRVHDLEVIETRRPSTKEETAPHSDGTLHSYLTTKFPILDAGGAVISLGIIGTDITERKRVEEAVRESQETLRTVIDAVPAVINARDRTGRYILMNAHQAGLIGIDPLEAVGKTVEEIRGARVATFKRSIDERVIATGHGVMTDEVVSGYGDRDYTWLTNDAPMFDASGNVSGIVTVAIDITERKAAEEALRKSETRLRAFMEHLPAAASIKDTEGRYVLVNERLQELTDKRSEECIGATPYDLFPREVAERVDAETRTVLRTNEKLLDEETLALADGVHTYLTLKFPISDEAGEVINIGSIATDITERKRLEHQLIQSSKLAILGEMAAGLAHEFSQPLNIIRLASESALILMEEDEADADRQRKQFEKINGQAQRMIEIVNHVNSFARVDVGEPKPFDPVGCIEDAIALASDHFGTDDVVITTRMPRSCSQVLGHRVRLEQVVVNLLNNARDAILTIRQRKPGALSKGEIAVEVADYAQKDTIHVLVTDNGGGIPPDLIESLFEPFFTTKPMGRGTGLGLSISADIVADMGGMIDVKNVEGGARFEIALPVYAERELGV